MSVHGYLRVSTLDKGQTVENQRIAIRDAGFAIDFVYPENGVSGSIRAKERPEFAKMLEAVVSGDTVVVSAIDRLGRDAEDILNTVNTFQKMGVRVCVLNLGTVDITSTMGKAFVTMLSALAEMERNNLRERTRQGLIRTKEEGTYVGRPLVIHPDILERIVFEKSKDVSVECLAYDFNIPKKTIYRNLNKWGNNLEGYREEWEKRNEQYGKKVA